MSRTHHHRHQRKNKRRYEVWSKRCRLVSMWAFDALMKRITHRFERREGKLATRNAFVTDTLYMTPEQMQDLRAKGLLNYTRSGA